LKSRLHNKKELKETRKKFRRNATSAEAVLWKRLKNKQIKRLKFRRQHSVGKFILDFYCAEKKLAIELDGEYHAIPGKETSDSKRDIFLKSFGIEILRFENKIVFENPELIIEEITKVAGDKI
jgi:very-short-patch-repair endonuclease